MIHYEFISRKMTGCEYLRNLQYNTVNDEPELTFELNLMEPYQEYSYTDKIKDKIPGSKIENVKAGDRNY